MKSTCCSSRRLRWVPSTYIRKLTTTHNSSSEGYDFIFLLSHNPRAFIHRGWNTNTILNALTHENLPMFGSRSSYSSQQFSTAPFMNNLFQPSVAEDGTPGIAAANANSYCSVLHLRLHICLQSKERIQCS